MTFDKVGGVVSPESVAQLVIELQAPADAKTHPFYSDIPAEWGRQWPGEEIWVARKK